MAKITIEIEGKTVEVEAQAKTFSSGTKGFYFRDRVKVGDKTYHAQIILSDKS
jgi:hypothetical protein